MLYPTIWYTYIAIEKKLKYVSGTTLNLDAMAEKIFGRYEVRIWRLQICWYKEYKNEILTGHMTDKGVQYLVS